MNITSTLPDGARLLGCGHVMRTTSTRRERCGQCVLRERSRWKALRWQRTAQMLDECIQAGTVPICAGCTCTLTPDTRTVDHVVPIVRGGSHDLANLQWLCMPCNAAKKTNTMTEWMAKR